ncbi:unnamed protein product [Hermetia illucens]|uniref:Uncharacterized protein n=1 Tax=Hermetia illucens TaxID=343691 RepID=A0A7R8UNX4_HERIL|nr:unnamed protein product [Hermetia illucens]
MEQLFTTYPNYFADQFGKSRPENSIIDKYLESRMKMRVDSKAASGNNLPSFLKTQKNNSNLKQENASKQGAINLKSSPAQLANSKTSQILESVRKMSPNIHNYTNSNIQNGSNEFYNFSNQNSIFSPGLQKEDPDGDDSTFSGNFKDSTEPDTNVLRDEEYLGDHKYEYNKELEKTDEKDTVSIKESEDHVSWDINDKVARILKLVQLDDHSEGSDNKRYYSTYDNDRDYFKDKENIEVWAGQDNRYSYYVFFVMVLTIAIGTFLRSANRLLATVKVVFDMVFVSCWSWARNIFSPIHNNDGSVFLFILCTPVLAFLLVLYAGFSIVYFSNKALLSRVPDKIAEQVNLKKIKDLTT